MDIISTKGVAEVIGVSEATVKRWADAGTLKCFRTAGGHRKFRLRDVKAFLSDQQFGEAAFSEPAVSPPAGELDNDQREARNLALASDVDGLVSLIANQRLKGLSLAHAFDEIVAPAMNDIGEGWAQGKISPAQEHIASNAVIEMMARVRPLVERTSRTDRGRAFCGCLGGENHDIGVRVVGLILAAEGFRTSMLGANVPAGDLALLVAGERPAVLALSSSPCGNLDLLRGDLAVVASAATSAKTTVVVGGEGFLKLGSLPATVKRFAKLKDLLEAVSMTGASTR